MAERLDPAARDRELNRRILEARVLTVVAMLHAGRRPPTAYEVSTHLASESGADVERALVRLAREGRIAEEREPDPHLPLIAPPIVRYRAVALVVGSTLPAEGGEG